MENIIVLGIGNRLMMDDGVGIYLAEEIALQNKNSTIQYIIGESDVEYCIGLIEKATFVILLDAIFSGCDPGDVTVYPLESLNGFHTLDISPHNLHLFQILHLSKDRIKGYIIGVEPYEIKFNIGLSEKLEQQWGIIIKNVENIIDKLIESIS
ncbi:hydrogenase maturation protease [Rummeliibacillus pycnus]|uniref:hydrogenase maturation protease n=1 Tax=Rummeliibacillus pycnus TaxID=101070 RepID=UPI000C9ACB0E|nr:hydrogenase maturation protease [Rummeliibacillus pycnus]